MKNETTVFRGNPMIRGLVNMEHAESEADKATYKGVFKKTAFFIALTFIGYALYYILHEMFFKQGIHQIALGEDGGFALALAPFAVVALVAALILCIVCPIVASVSPRFAPVFGGFYSILQGFLIGGIIKAVTSSGKLADIGGEPIAIFVLAATGIIVATMALLYQNGILRATTKFRGILCTTVVATAIVSFAAIVLSLIPATSGLVAVLVNNPVYSIAFTVFGVILASLFLISDFGVIESTVEGGLHKKYEWTAAFGLAITIIWIYLKVLELVLKILGSKK